MRTTAMIGTLAWCLSSCLGTTGNTLVHFQAAAAGPADAAEGKPLEFSSGDWHVVLTKATLHVGAMYLIATSSTSGGGPAPCFLQGTYVGEVTTDPDATAGIDVDILSPRAQLFPNYGEGTSLPARAGQVWLTGVQVDVSDDATTILHLEGTANRGEQVIPFTGNITIGRNRTVTPSDSSKPGSNPICHERIVALPKVDVVPRDTGTLLLRIDPRLLFLGIDFSTLKQLSSTPPLYRFADNSNDEPSALLYSLIHSSALYQFTWEDSL